MFPVRGQPDLDRDFRHPRVKGEKAQKRELAKAAASLKANRLTIQDGDLLLSGEDRLEQEWKLLPPLPDIVQAVNRFTHYYFQLGFIPKALFPNRLERNPRSVSVFLLLSILSISARFTPAIAQSYGGGVQAAERFMKRASSLAMRELYEEPTLERCQAFYLLSVAQQGSGSMNKSYVRDWPPTHTVTVICVS